MQQGSVVEVVIKGNLTGTGLIMMYVGLMRAIDPRSEKSPE
jgi:hypothetical protein